MVRGRARRLFGSIVEVLQLDRRKVCSSGNDHQTGKTDSRLLPPPPAAGVWRGSHAASKKPGQPLGCNHGGDRLLCESLQHRTDGGQDAARPARRHLKTRLETWTSVRESQKCLRR